MKSLLRYASNLILGWLAVMALVFIFTVSLQHLRKGSAEEVMMGQRGASAQQKDQTYFMRITQLAQALPEIPSWKSLRGTPILPQVGIALKATALLTALSLIFSVGIALITLLAAQFFPRIRELLKTFSVGINTTPIFLVGIFFIWLLAFALRLLPSGGDDGLRFFLLPALTISTKFGLRLFLLLQNYMDELESKIFILRARAFGFSERKIFWHKLVNCAMPFLIFWLIETASLFSGAVIVEALFSIHGLGQLLLFALLQYDIKLIFTNLVVIASIVYCTSLLQKAFATSQEQRA